MHSRGSSWSLRTLCGLCMSVLDVEPGRALWALRAWALALEPHAPPPGLPLLPQVFVVEFWGRRRLLLLGFSTCFLACVVLTVALVLQVRSGRSRGVLSLRGPRPSSPYRKDRAQKGT